MTNEQMIRELRAVAEKYKGKHVFTCETNINLMATDAASRIESLCDEINRQKAEIERLEAEIESKQFRCDSCDRIGLTRGGERNMIKDSGNRREFDTGAVRDIQEGKGRMDLLPWSAIMEVSKHCENGARKYGEHNVDKGIPTHSLCDSAARHLAKYLDGWDDEPHLLASAWNLLWAIQMELKHPELCDVPWRDDNEG